ncbi:MAG: hypothetical protein HOP10_09270 [Chitinophagaceae bacterium]|nr:hypothetical protein [Chitinophagaceae bacterium]
MSNRKAQTVKLKITFLGSLFLLAVGSVHSQLKWINVDSLYQPLPSSVHIYFTDSQIDSGKFRAYYLIADLKDKDLEFLADTSKNRRLTPAQFYTKNEKPLVVVNCTYFSFETNKNFNVVINNGQVLSGNRRVIKGTGRDSISSYFLHASAIGINKKRQADVAWIKADSMSTKAYAMQDPPIYSKLYKKNRSTGETTDFDPNNFANWKMKTAVGGGPVLVQAGQIRITNEEEKRFTGKSLYDKHPRTAMGYTKDGKLIILVVEGRNKDAGGATLTQEAQIFKDLGCWEALNLDGGGSSCLLVNGKETIKVSDATGQRPVPAVFLIKNKE